MAVFFESKRGLLLKLAVAMAVGLAGCGGSDNAQPQVSISVQPASKTAVAGEPVTFSVSAAGGQLSFQWQRDGVNVDGANSSTFTLPVVRMSDDGSRWSVVVTSAGKSVSSSAGVLSVKPPQGISVVAGVIGGAGNADGSPGRFISPFGLAVDESGVIHVSDWLRMRTLSPGVAGQYTAGTRFAADWYCCMVADGNGNLFAIDGNRIVKISAAGVISTVAGTDDEGRVNGGAAVARFSQPFGLARDAAGNLHVVDGAGLRLVSPSGFVSTHPANGAQWIKAGESFGQPFYLPYPLRSIATDGAGALYLGGDRYVRKVDPSGAISDIPIASGQGMAVSKDGVVYAMDENVLRKVMPGGTVLTLAGKQGQAGIADGTGEQARLGADINDRYARNGSMVLDKDGNVLWSDVQNRSVRKITPAGVVTTIGGKTAQDGTLDGVGDAARLGGVLRNLGIDAAGLIYANQMQYEGDRVRTVSKTGVVRTLNWPRLDKNNQKIEYFPEGLAFGGRVIAVANGLVSRVNADGSLEAIAGKAGSRTWNDGAGSQASFGVIVSLARDGQGNLYIVDKLEVGKYPDNTPMSDFAIRKISPAGDVSTVRTFRAATTKVDERPQFIVSDKDGNLVVTAGKVLLRLAADGKSSSTPNPVDLVTAIALDKAGVIYIAGDYGMVTRIDANGASKVVAGKPGSIGVALGGLPGSLGEITGLVVDDSGVIYVASENAVLRVVQ